MTRKVIGVNDPKPTTPPRKGTYWHRMKGGPLDGQWIERPLSMKK